MKKKQAVRCVLAIASGGGHWQQLMAMRAAWEGLPVHYATTLPGLAEQYEAVPASLVPDCNANEPVAALRCAARMMMLMLRLRPSHVVTTGALPGLIAVACGRLVGARTLWIDSVANGETLSASGRHAKRLAQQTLSQWPAVAAAEGVSYEGRIL